MAVPRSAANAESGRVTSGGAGHPLTGFPFLDQPCPLAFAHRGGAGEAEENSPAAFENAAALGYRHVETDIQAAKDGVAVVFHDDTLDRLTEAQGPIAQWSWSALRRVHTRGGQRLMRLDDALTAWPGLCFNLEPKSDAAAAPLAEAVRRCAAVDRVCAGSFSLARTERLRRLLGPRLCWSPSYGGVFRLWLAGWGVPLGRPAFPVVQVPPRHHGIPVVTKRFIQAAHSRGVHVHVWTVDTREEIDAFLTLGVDGLMSDYPSLLRDVLRARNLWRDE